MSFNTNISTADYTYSNNNKTAYNNVYATNHAAISNWLDDGSSNTGDPANGLNPNYSNVTGTIAAALSMRNEDEQ